MDWRMLRDVKRRKLAYEYADERLRINAIRKNTILPKELQVPGGCPAAVPQPGQGTSPCVAPTAGPQWPLDRSEQPCQVTNACVFRTREHSITSYRIVTTSARASPEPLAFGGVHNNGVFAQLEVVWVGLWGFFLK